MQHMRRFLCALAVVGASTLHADAALRIYFSTVGPTDPDKEIFQEGDPTGGLIPGTDAPEVGVPTLPATGGRLYVWAQMNRDMGGPDRQSWVGIGLNVRCSGTSTIANWHYYDLQVFMDLSDPTSLSYARFRAQQGHRASEQEIRDCNLIIGSGRNGFTNNSASRLGDYHSEFFTRDTISLGTPEDQTPREALLGWVDVGPGPGSVFLGIGFAGIARMDVGLNDWIGFGDAPYFFGGQAGTESPVPNAYVAPEPAALTLLSIAAALKRCRR